MKPVHTTLLASAFLAVSYIAAPGTVSAGGRECMAQSISKSVAAQQVDFDLEVALKAARNGKSVRAEVQKIDDSVVAEDSAWFDVPDQCHIQELLAEELADLHARADAYVAHEADILKFQFHVALGRFERAVEEIHAAWSKGLIADDIAEKAIYEMRVIAFDYVHSLVATDIRAALQVALETMIKRGILAEERAAAQQELYVKVYSLRLEAALAFLQERVAKGIATKQDYLRIAKYVAALERLQTLSKPFDCGS